MALRPVSGVSGKLNRLLFYSTWSVVVRRRIREIVHVHFSIPKDHCGQSYKHFALVNYDSKVVIWGNFQSGTTLES